MNHEQSLGYHMNKSSDKYELDPFNQLIKNITQHSAVLLVCFVVPVTIFAVSMFPKLLVYF